MKKTLLFLGILTPILLFAQDVEVQESITQNSLLIQQFSQLAPMSINPYAAVFFTSLCSKLEIHNQFVATNPFFNSWFTLIIFGALFGFTSIVGTVISASKVAASIKKADDYLQNKAAILINGFIMLTPMFFSNNPAHNKVVYEAGIFSFDVKTIMILVASTYFLMVVMTVRYFLDLLIWLSPIPLIDSILEITKVIFTSLLVGISIIWPTTSVIIFAIMLLTSLFFYKKALRTIDRIKYLILYPIFNIFRDKNKILTDGKSFSVLVLLKQKHNKLKRGKIARLEKKEDGFYISQYRFLLPNKKEKITFENCYLLQHHLSITLKNENDIHFVFNRSYHKFIEEISKELGVEIKETENVSSGIGKGLLNSVKNMFSKEDISDLRSISE